MNSRRLFLASVCFAWGALVLLAAAPFELMFGVPFIFYFGSWFVGVLLLGGYYHVAEAVLLPDPSQPGSQRRRLPLIIFGASVVGFVISFADAPRLFPSLAWGVPGFVWILLYGYYLFVPSVYAPVLVGNGILFAIAARDRTRFARPFLLVAAVALVEIAAIGVAAEILWFPDQWRFFFGLFIILPGLTGPAYVLAAFGLWREHRFTFESFRGSAAPERT